MKSINFIVNFFASIIMYQSSALAQSIDYAVEVKSGLFTKSVEIVDGMLMPDERWRVIGGCSNFPNLKIEIVDGMLMPDLRVEIVDGMLMPDKTVCITNAKELDVETLKLLKLID